MRNGSWRRTTSPRNATGLSTGLREVAALYASEPREPEDGYLSIMTIGVAAALSRAGNAFAGFCAGNVMLMCWVICGITSNHYIGLSNT